MSPLCWDLLFTGGWTCVVYFENRYLHVVGWLVWCLRPPGFCCFWSVWLVDPSVALLKQLSFSFLFHYLAYSMCSLFLAAFLKNKHLSFKNTWGVGGWGGDIYMYYRHLEQPMGYLILSCWQTVLYYVLWTDWCGDSSTYSVVVEVVVVTCILNWKIVLSCVDCNCLMSVHMYY